MAFSKTFPRTVSGTNYPIWEEIYLTQEEESQIEEQCKRENFQLMDDCIKEAKILSIKNQINEDNVISKIAIALFEKKASHIVF